MSADLRRAAVCAAAILALAAPAHASEKGDPPATWQYFCFDSATQFAEAATKTIFSLLPDPEGGSAERRRAEAASASSSSSGGDSSAATTIEQATTRLAGLRGTCYFMRVGYWTYEVCPWATVRQYHSESGGAGAPTVHSEHSLGKYAGDGSDEFNADRVIYSQQFTGGAEGRSSVVRYLCPDSWRDEDGIVLVNEPTPKHYVITLRVQALCDADGAAAVAGAPTRGRPAAAAGAPTRAARAAAAQEDAAEKAEAAASGMQIAEMILPNTRLLSSLRGRCATAAAAMHRHAPPMHAMRARVCVCASDLHTIRTCLLHTLRTVERH